MIISVQNITVPLFAVIIMAFIVLSLIPRSASAAAVALSNATTTSSNASTTLSKVGDTVSYQLNLSGAPSSTSTPVINIQGMGSTTMTGTAGVSTVWTYSTTTASSGWTEGNIAFQFGWGGTLGEATTTFMSSASTTLRNVRFDKTRPTMSTTVIASSNASSTLAAIGDVVTLSFLANETIQTPTVTIAGRAADHVLGTTTPASFWTASTTIVSGDTSGTAFSISITDPAGNASSTAQTAPIASTSVAVYASLPSVTIAGSNPDTVYASASAPYSDSGATATDALSASLSVSTSGSVDRTIVGSYTLTYTATDAAGNSNNASRPVTVRLIASNGPIVSAASGNMYGGGAWWLTTQPAANASAAASLQGQLSALQSRIAALTGSPASSGSENANANASFKRNLTIGATGTDVMALQVWLNGHGYPIASSGPGSAGKETTLFGPRTRSALAKWQAAVGISPAAGYFGPKTRAYLATH